MVRKANDWTKDELMKEYVSKYTPVTIPVDVSIEGRHTILDLSRMEKILQEARIIAVENCGCRDRLGKCEAPLDVCLSLDRSAEKALKSGAKKISKSQALEIMKRSHEAGLVHVSYTIKGEDRPFIICSCCSCCCHSLSALVRFGIPDHVITSELIASDSHETCDDCGVCVERCQFHARHLVDDRLKFDQAKCFGCGLCVSRCPTESIKLIPRKTPQKA